jgi:hypothetical protein
MTPTTLRPTIVVGYDGSDASRAALLGSVSHELLHIADRPVVVIPTAAIQPEVRASESGGTA